MVMKKQKLEKREVVILVIMAVAILYGVATFILGKSTKKVAVDAAHASAELKTLTSEIALSMTKNALSSGEAYAINRAEEPWQNDPFYERKAYEAMLKSKETNKALSDINKKVTFSYTGYMEYHGRRVAIVNGLEYSAGEPLETRGYVLRTISPRHVVIENIIERVKMEVPIDD